MRAFPQGLGKFSQRVFALIHSVERNRAAYRLRDKAAGGSVSKC